MPESLAYGETPAVSVRRLLQVAGLEPGQRLVDLGSGRGLAACAAACLGFRAAGLEYFSRYVEGARQVAADLGLEVPFECGDFLTAPWPAGDLYYLASTAFGDRTRAALLPRLLELPAGTRVATLDWVLEEPEFVGLAAVHVPVTWGVARACVYELSAAAGGD
ncbi:MAG: methyltransferase [Candidatus Eremiobacterota bacterium]